MADEQKIIVAGAILGSLVGMAAGGYLGYNMDNEAGIRNNTRTKKNRIHGALVAGACLGFIGLIGGAFATIRAIATSEDIPKFPSEKYRFFANVTIEKLPTASMEAKGKASAVKLS